MRREKILGIICCVTLSLALGQPTLLSAPSAAFTQHYNAGQEFLTQSQYSSAIVEFRKALRINFMDNSARIGLINSYLARATYYANQEKNYDKSANDFRSASQIQAQEFEETPGNYLKGFFGSLIGAVVGAVVWFVLYYFVGIVSAWLGLLTVMLSDFLYVKFEGKKKVETLVVSAFFAFSLVNVPAKKSSISSTAFINSRKGFV